MTPKIMIYPKNHANIFQGFVEIDKLILEPLTEKHVADIYSITSDSYTMRLYGHGRAWNYESTKKWITRLYEDTWKNSPYGSFAITLRANEYNKDINKTSNANITIGVIALGDSPTPEFINNLGINAIEAICIINKLYQVKGYAYLAGVAITSYCKEAVRQGWLYKGRPLDGVFATVDVKHRATQILLRKLGLTQVTPEPIFINGKIRLCYLITKDGKYPNNILNLT